MTISYTRDIPFATHNPSQDQPIMLANTNATYDILAIDHVTFNTTGSGFHNKSTYVAQGSDPGSSSDQIVFYGKKPASSTEVFLQRDGVATVTQLTAGIAKSGANTANSTNNGQSFIAGGFKVKFGTSVETAASRTIVFTTDANLDAFTTIYSVFVSPLTSTDTAKVNSISNTQFTMVVSTSGGLGVYWWAIGV